MTISVLIPTYCRPKELSRCLKALHRQERPADEILVVARESDSRTLDSLKVADFKDLPLRVHRITVAGVVAALNLGLDEANVTRLYFAP